MKKRGFTLVELLVVVAIILMLIMLMIPSLGDARETARKVLCRSRMRTVGVASLVFAQDHDGIPPSAGAEPNLGSELWQKAFMGQEVIYDGRAVNSIWPMGRYGTLLPYMGGSISNLSAAAARNLYRCPSPRETGVLFSGVGSNGYFDYCMFIAWNGCPLSQRPNTARIYRNGGGTATGPYDGFPTPWMLEEDPTLNCNRVSVEAGHGGGQNNLGDRLGRWHGKGTREGNALAVQGQGSGEGNVLAVDGSVHTLRAVAGRQPQCQDWFAVAPSGSYKTLYGGNYRYWLSQ